MAFDSRHFSPGAYSISTLPKSGCPVRGQIEVNSVAVSSTRCAFGAGNASAFKTCRASSGLLGRGSGPVVGSLVTPLVPFQLVGPDDSKGLLLAGLQEPLSALCVHMMQAPSWAPYVSVEWLERH